MKKMLNIFIYSSREKIMTVPRKKTQLDLKRMKKAETAAQLDKVFFFWYSLRPIINVFESSKYGCINTCFIYRYVHILANLRHLF